jgi:hypothetical protein
MTKARRFVLLAAVAGAFAGGGGATAVTTGVASASPGGLDGSGGHHCWTRCYRWGRYRGEYHCHRSPCNRRTIARHRAHGH